MVKQILISLFLLKKFGEQGYVKNERKYKNEVIKIVRFVIKFEFIEENIEKENGEENNGLQEILRFEDLLQVYENSSRIGRFSVKVLGQNDKQD